MKLRHTIIVLILLLALPALACGGESATSTPQISTAASSAPTEEAAATEPTAIPTEVVEETVAPTEAPPTEAAEPTEAPTDTPEPVQEANLGDLVEQGGYSLAVVTVEDPATSGMLYTPTEGTKLVAVEAIVGNVSGERITVNPLNSTLVDAEGFTYQAELAGRDGQIATVDIEAGERVKGWVAFEVPQDAEPATFKYEISGFPSLVLQSKLKTADGALVANPDVPLTASGSVDRNVTTQLGDVVESDGYSLTAEAVEDPATPGILYTPTEGKKLVAVQIVVSNDSGEVVTVNPLNAALVDTDGYVYTAELAGRDGQIETVDINAGEKVRGWVAFEVPEGSTPESIKYQVSSFPLIELQSGLSQ